MTPVHQAYLLQARQMQSLSFAVHIPLVCFGIAFPAIILFVEWLYLRSGDELYRRLARRWTRVMAALFAVGVITGTILSFEMGLLWPEFTARFGSVFGLGFAIEGFSFFMEAIFIGLYVYGWDRLTPRAHFRSGIPIAIAGFTGSLMVISVNAWMNHPSGFRLEHGRVLDVHPLAALFGNSFLWPELAHMYIAGYIVTGFLLAAAYAVGRLRGSWGRYERTALAIPLTIAALASPVQVLVGDWAARDVATSQPVKLAAIEGLQKTTKGASEHVLGWYTEGAGQVRHRDTEAALAARVSQPRSDRQGPGNSPGRPPAARQRRAHRVPADGGHRHAARDARRDLPADRVPAPATAELDLVLPRAGPCGTGFAGRAHRGLGDDRGGTPAVGGLSGHAHLRSRDGGRRHTSRLRHPGARLSRRGGRRLLDPASPRAGAAGPTRHPPSAARAGQDSLICTFTTCRSCSC